MPIKYGRCTNITCKLRGRTQDAEDSNFVCNECSMELSVAPPTSGRLDNSNKTLVIAAVLLVIFVSGGGYLWMRFSDLSYKPESPRSGSNDITIMSLQDWLKDYYVDR